MKRLIVTADDFGLSRGVVLGILEGHERGIVTSTSLMVNAPAAEEAFRAARDHRSLATGLHFVLSFGKPTGSPDAIETRLLSSGFASPTFRPIPSSTGGRCTRPGLVSTGATWPTWRRGGPAGSSTSTSSRTRICTMPISAGASATGSTSSFCRISRRKRFRYARSFRSVAARSSHGGRCPAHAPLRAPRPGVPRFPGRDRSGG